MEPLRAALAAFQTTGPMYIADHQLTPGQRPVLFLDPSLPAKPWHNEHHQGDLQQQCGMVRDEFARLEEEGRVVQVRGKSVRGDWKVYWLHRKGVWDLENCGLCPGTVEAVRALPMCDSSLGDVYFSVQAGGARVLPQYGNTNTTVQLLLGLESAGESMLQVHEQVRRWERGDVVAYDDSFLHSSWNDGIGRSVGLVVDLWHPGLSAQGIKHIQQVFPGGAELERAGLLDLILSDQYLVQEIAGHLPCRWVGMVSETCRCWSAVAQDDDLWAVVAHRALQLESMLGRDSWRAACKEQVLGTVVEWDEEYEDYTIAKIVLAGDYRVGVRSFMRQFAEGTTLDDLTTIGIDFKIRKLMCNGVPLKLQVWHHPRGVARFTHTHIRDAQWRGAHAVMLMYDITNAESFQNCRDWFRELQTYGPEDVVVGLVGCKRDLEPQRQVSREEAKGLAAELGCAVFEETSAETGDGVERAVVRVLRERLRLGALGPRVNPVPLPTPAGRSGSRCVVC
eukprot:TRINITY_DN7643_c0_g1_i2.p1 TRINITY_DN7643_c0_g1~~TRINITY_DN7643_c0_g1_i2.p1  ORF type:complete len:507 (+),score=95.39 TRINITY_DN7643_c0_g1_i2:201-1721(+)